MKRSTLLTFATQLIVRDCIARGTSCTPVAAHLIDARPVFTTWIIHASIDQSLTKVP